MLDECHKAKNLVPSGSSKPTKTGLTVLDLQKKLPKARVIYCSATGRKSIAIYYKIWIKFKVKTAFSVDHGNIHTVFVNSIQAGQLGLVILSRLI